MFLFIFYFSFHIYTLRPLPINSINNTKYYFCEISSNQKILLPLILCKVIRLE